MMNREYSPFANEYPTASGVLVIENIVNGQRKKTDVIRELLENETCLFNEALVQSDCRNTADCGSQKKEAEI